MSGKGGGVWERRVRGRRKPEPRLDLTTGCHLSTTGAGSEDAEGESRAGRDVDLLRDGAATMGPCKSWWRTGTEPDPASVRWLGSGVDEATFATPEGGRARDPSSRTLSAMGGTLSSGSTSGRDSDDPQRRVAAKEDGLHRVVWRASSSSSSFLMRRRSLLLRSSSATRFLRAALSFLRAVHPSQGAMSGKR